MYACILYATPVIIKYCFLCIVQLWCSLDVAISIGSNYETDTQSNYEKSSFRGYYSAYSRLWSLRFLVATLLRGYYNIGDFRMYNKYKDVAFL